MNYVHTMSELLDQSLANERLLASLSVIFGLLATLLAMVGLYGVVAYMVTRRTREIGIRMAIGARGGDVLTQFLVESVVMCLLGGIVGLAAGAGGAALVGHFTGWTVTTPASAVLLAVGFSAAVGIFFGYYPARKAASLDPIQALRFE
jgi:putative ABC transport system permease protein